MQVTLSLLPGPNNFDRHGSAESGFKAEALSEFRILNSRSKGERKNDRRSTADSAANFGLLSCSRAN